MINLLKFQRGCRTRMAFLPQAPNTCSQETQNSCLLFAVPHARAVTDWLIWGNDNESSRKVLLWDTGNEDAPPHQCGSPSFMISIKGMNPFLRSAYHADRQRRMVIMWNKPFIRTDGILSVSLHCAGDRLGACVVAEVQSRHWDRAMHGPAGSCENAILFCELLCPCNFFRPCRCVSGCFHAGVITALAARRRNQAAAVDSSRQED